MIINPMKLNDETKKTFSLLLQFIFGLLSTKLITPYFNVQIGMKVKNKLKTLLMGMIFLLAVFTGIIQQKIIGFMVDHIETYDA